MAWYQLTRKQWLWLLPLSLLHPIGEALQFFIIGPTYIRWYMSTFGASFSLILFFIVYFKRKPFTAYVIGNILPICNELLQYSVGDGDHIDMILLNLAAIIGLYILKCVR